MALKPVSIKEHLNSYKVGEEITCFVSKVQLGSKNVLDYLGVKDLKVQLTNCVSPCVFLPVSP